MATVTWNSNVYSQQRSVLKIENIDVSGIAGGNIRRIVVNSSGTETTRGRYYIEYQVAVPSTVIDLVELDLTDLVRALPDAASVAVYACSGDDDENDYEWGTTISWQTVGTKNPQTGTAFAPETEGALGGICLVSPPQMVLTNTIASYIEVLYSGAPFAAFTGYDAAGVASSLTISQNSLLVPAGIVRIKAVCPPLRIVQEIPFIPQNDCADYVVMRWQSRFGNIKQAVWERGAVTESTTDALNIANINTPYDVRKGLQNAMRIVLRDLSAYDYWYYADIITSSDVQLYVNRTWVRVEVVTKDAQIPVSSDGEHKELEVELNYAQYDTI